MLHQEGNCRYGDKCWRTHPPRYSQNYPTSRRNQTPDIPQKETKPITPRRKRSTKKGIDHRADHPQSTPEPTKNSKKTKHHPHPLQEKPTKTQIPNPKTKPKRGLRLRREESQQWLPQGIWTEKKQGQPDTRYRDDQSRYQRGHLYIYVCVIRLRMYRTNWMIRSVISRWGSCCIYNCIICIYCFVYMLIIFMEPLEDRTYVLYGYPQLPNCSSMWYTCILSGIWYNMYYTASIVVENKFTYLPGNDGLDNIPKQAKI